MHRIDGEGATEENEFTDGETGPPAVMPTVVTADWLNAVQGELVNAIEAAGVTLDKEDNTQLAKAIQLWGGVSGDVMGNGFPVMSTYLVPAHTLGLNNTWQSIGPTDSGANYEWSALDDLDDDIVWIKIRLNYEYDASGISASQKCYGKYYARTGGSAAGQTYQSTVHKVAGYPNSSGYISIANSDEIKLYVSNKMFEIAFEGDGTGFTSPTLAQMFLLDYGWK